MSAKYKKGEFGLFPALQLKGLDPYKQTVMAWLIYHTNNKGQCFPSIDLLSQETGISKRKLVDTLKELHQMGLIGKTIRNNRSGRQSTLYTVYKTMPKKTPSAGGAITPSAGDATTPSASGATRTQVHEAHTNQTQGTKPSKDGYATYTDGIWGGLQKLAREHGKVVFSKKADYVAFFRSIGDMDVVTSTMNYLMSDANFKAEYGWKNAPFSVSKLKIDWNAVQDKASAKKVSKPIISGGFQ